MSDSTKTLRFVRNNFLIQFKGEENLLELLNANKVGINQSCGGNGTCATCKVVVHEGLEFCSEKTELEVERSEERQYDENERLACQTTICDSLLIDIEFDSTT